MYPIIPYLEEVGLEVELLYIGNLRSPLGVLRAIKEIREKANDYDIIHPQYGSMCGLIASYAGRNTPLVLSLRGSDWNRYTRKINKIFFHTFLAHFFSRMSLSRASAILPVSNRMIASLPNKYHCISHRFPSAIDLSKWPVKKTTEYGSKKILFVAQKSKSPNKQINLLDKVVAGVKEYIPDIIVNVAESIPFTEMPHFVSQHDLLLCLSDNEGWPNSVKEALACNVPFVATDVSDLKEISQVEKSCRVCERNLKELVEACVTILHLDLSEIDLRRYVEEMDVRVQAERLKKIYGNILIDNRL